MSCFIDVGQIVDLFAFIRFQSDGTVKSLAHLLNPLQLATSTLNHLLFVPLAAKSSLCLILVLRKLASSSSPHTVLLPTINVSKSLMFAFLL
jgi:hypothetical protein